MNLQRVKEHDQRRMKKMQELIEERTAQLKAHEAGHRRLSDEVGKIQVFKFSFLHTE